ncbi:MAG: hypothetical protein WDW38_006689 [Sanguina aurantia]
MAAAAVVYRILFIVDPGLANVGLAVYVVGVGFLYIEVANVKAEGQASHGQKVDMERFNRCLQAFLSKMPPGGRRHEAVALIENQYLAERGIQSGTIEMETAFKYGLSPSVAEVVRVNAGHKFQKLLIGHKSHQDRVELKKLSVAYIKHWLNTEHGREQMPAALRAMYEGSEKQDDMADAMMMALAYVGLPKIPASSLPIPHRNFTESREARSVRIASGNLLAPKAVRKKRARKVKVEKAPQPVKVKKERKVKVESAVKRSHHKKKLVLEAQPEAKSEAHADAEVEDGSENETEAEAEAEVEPDAQTGSGASKEDCIDLCA